MYQHRLPADIRPCCGLVNRGLAILDNRVFFGTIDAHVIALDAKTGNVAWDIVAADYQKGYSFTVAPLAVKNLIVIGVSGGEYGVRGFIDAYDAATGERKWRFYTVPEPGEPGGKLAGRSSRGWCGKYSKISLRSQMWFPPDSTEIPSAIRSSAILGVMPNPAAEFSALAITRSTDLCVTMSCKRSCTILRPGEPTMSPMNKSRIGSD